METSNERKCLRNIKMGFYPIGVTHDPGMTFEERLRELRAIGKKAAADFAEKFAPLNQWFTIAGLSSGEFVGMVADDPTNKIKLKTFHCEILNQHDLLKAEADAYRSLPGISEVHHHMVGTNFKTIKKEVTEIIEEVIERVLNTPGLERISKQ